MKFLVLALCVCAASAASLGNTYPRPPSQAQQVTKTVARTVVAPFAAAPVVAANAAYSTAQVAAEVPIVAAKAIYNAGKEAYGSGKEAEAAIVRSDSDVAPDSFKYSYETSNGIEAQATGIAKKVGNDDVIAVQGSYKFFTPEGQVVEITYVADENGFQPQGDSIPVAPPVPEAIARSLEYIHDHPYQGEKY